MPTLEEMSSEELKELHFQLNAQVESMKKEESSISDDAYDDWLKAFRKLSNERLEVAEEILKRVS